MNSSKHDNEIDRLHLQFYKYIKKKALSLEGEVSKELKQYRKDQDYYSNRQIRASNEQELLTSVRNSNVIYIGDFHTFDQYTKNFLRVMKQLLKNRKKFTLALEMVSQKNQQTLDAYCKGNITEIEFLEEINYKQSWNFPWGHYKEIFELANKNKIKIIGINNEGTLLERDEYAAKLLYDTYKKDKQQPILVLIGELHILPNKLPRLLLLKSKGHLRHTIIHQNSDDLYWRLKENNINQKIIKFNDHEFSLQTAPPWNKYESLVYWVENLHDDPDFDIHEHMIETGLKILSGQHTENFLKISTDFAKTLNLNFLELSKFENFNLYDQTSLEYIEISLKEISPFKLAKFYEYLLTSNETFFIKENNFIYCPNYSINRLSYTAGIFLFAQICDHFNYDQTKIIVSKKIDESFFIFFLSSFFGYLSSKMVNPYRKCDLYLDYQSVKNNKKTLLRKKNYVSKLLTILDYPEDISSVLRGLSLAKKFRLARDIGHIYSEYFFNFMQENDKDDTSTLLNEVIISILTSKDRADIFVGLKQKLLSRYHYQNDRKRIF